MKNLENFDTLGIAIIGMAGKWPGAKNLEEFWSNLRDGVESISCFSNEELESSGIAPAILKEPNYIKTRPIIEDIDLFDTSFFGFTPREAEVMDPQHRLFLECAWEALEYAGYDPNEGQIGVYAGASMSGYLLNLYANSDLMASMGQLVTISNDKDYLATRLSYKLNLKGPSYTIQTACSTSLVAVHVACQSLLNSECDMALAGGISIKVPQKTGYLYQGDGTVSSDGHCRAFDARADGTIFGSGMGLVVLKRLEDAITDGDCIHAIIRGSAINNDGSLKVSYAAPSVDGQANVILEALADAGVEPNTINYVETHGTGTTLGDAIEIAALTQAFRTSTNKKGFCAIGSVKTNIGHLEPAAGVTGLIKTVLALKHKQIPPSLHFETPNPKIDFDKSPFYVNTTLSEWQTNGTPRRAGISSFGLGGTNAHVILEEAPPQEDSGKSRPWQLLVLSAKTHSALETATANLAEYLKQQPNLNLADVAYTLQVGRRAFPHRCTVVCRGVEDAIAALEDPKRALASIQETSTRPVAFMFTGLGSHYLNMGWELYQVEPIFQGAVDDCCQFLKPLLGLDLKDVIYPNNNQNDSPGQNPASGLDLRKMLARHPEQPDEATEKLNQTYLTQPAIFVIEYALAQLWMSWGIRPAALIGYSIGEYVAATVAGVLSLEDALTLVAKRAQMIQELPGGTMLAVPLSEQEVRPLLGNNLCLSAINGSSQCVIAGATSAVDQLEHQLSQRGLACRRLVTSHAFHSYMMDALAQPLTELVKTLTLHPPQIPYLSNVTGTWITAEQATAPNYWARHLCEPVRFADGVQQLWKKHKPILLEVGPGQTLSSLALQCLQSEQVTDAIVLPSLRYSYDRQSDVAFLLRSLGQLWLSGVQIDWSSFYANERRYRIPLPTYPFERQRYWIARPKPEQALSLEAVSNRKKPNPADWFYIPVWKQSMPPVPFEADNLAQKNSCWLIFVDEYGIGSQIVSRLKHKGHNVISVRAGDQFCRFSDGEYTLNHRKEDDYNALIKDLIFIKKIPNTIVHLWSVKPDEAEQLGVERFEKIQHSGFYSLLFLTKVLDKQIITDPLKIWVLSNGMHRVESTDVFYPEKSTLLGLCKVIPQEYSNITCNSIDLVLPQSQEKLIDQLMAELTGQSSDLAIAYRGNQRWLQTFEPVRFDRTAARPKRLREGGVYLIAGGLGGIALTLAKYLAQSVRAKLVLVGRSGLPARQEWEQWLATHDERDTPDGTLRERTRTRIRKVQELEALGAEVLVIKADVANEAQMQAAIAQTEERFGNIHGVIYAAATLGEKLYRTIPETGYAECEWQFHPKVYGLYTLEKVLQGKELDYCLLISSIGAVLGGVAVAAYTAANIFMDAFAHQQNALQQVNWCSANWFHAETEEQTEEIFQQETIDTFQRILSNSLISQVALWRSDLTTAINKWIKREFEESTEDVNVKVRETTPALYPHSNRRNSYVAPRNESERKMANLYQKFLGIEQVGIHDNFFDLGGNSLIGTQLISHIRKDFNVELSIRSFFEANSIAELVEVIEEKIIEELEELTEEEAEALASTINQPR